MSAWVGSGGARARRLHDEHRPPLRASARRGRPHLGRDPGRAARSGVRFHPTRGSMSLSKKDGGLPPDSVVQDDDEILADSERLVGLHHDPSWGAMVRIALAPCSPFSVTPELMRATAELAERLDVRLHTHLAEDPDEDTFAEETFGRRTIEQFEEVGWGSDRAWVAHCIYPNDDEVARLGKWGTGVAHCPSSNMLIGGGGIAPGARVPRRGRARRPRLRRLRVDRLRVAVDGGAQRVAARPPAQGPDVDGCARRARDRDARLGRLPRARGRARAAVGGRGRRPRVLAARRRRVRGRADRSDRGVVAVRTRSRPGTRSCTARSWSRTARSSPPGEDDMLQRHRTISARIQGV